MSKKVENWATKRTSKPYKSVEDLYEKLEKAYENRDDIDSEIAENWDIYNAQLGDNQVYNGNTKTYVPAVRDAVNARAKRTLKQLFPNKYSHVEAVGVNADKPAAQLALLEHYIRTTKLKSVVRSMLIAGDVTGQWGIMIDWYKMTRTVSGAVRRNPIVEGLEDEVVDPTDSEEVLEDYEVTEEGPELVDFAAEDLVVLPPNAPSIEKSKVSCLKLRMTKDQVKKMVDEGVFHIKEDTELDDWVKGHKGRERKNPDKERLSAAGIKTEGTLSVALIYWAQTLLEFEPGKKQLADVYMAGKDEILGILKAEQWGGKRSIITAPVDRVSGSFTGKPKISAGVKQLQYSLNDFWNMGQDSAMYSLLPVVMTDPVKNPNYAMMVYGLAAVWPVDPNSTKPISFPQLWKDAEGICAGIKSQIQESMDVNPMMMGVMPKGRKNNQMVGGVQQEQSVSVTDHAERFEEEILNPLMERLFEYDAQYRSKELEVVTLGELGARSMIQSIPVQQWGERYFFQWTGTDFAMNMQRMQQQIATMNVLRGIPPQQLNGRRLDITPILESLVGNVFGAELGSKILIDERQQFTVPPEVEDEMLVNQIYPEVHPADDDMQHLQAHQQSAQMTGDPSGMFRRHIQEHMKQLQGKRQAALPPPPQGAQGMPGGAGPGVAGTPRMGAQPGQTRPMQQPAGMIPQDNMPGAPGRG